MWKYACIQRMLSVTRSCYLCRCVCLLSRLNMGRHPNLACPFFFFFFSRNQENELSGSDKETCLTRAAVVPWKRLFMNMYSIWWGEAFASNFPNLFISLHRLDFFIHKTGHPFHRTPCCCMPMSVCI